MTAVLDYIQRCRHGVLFRKHCEDCTPSNRVMRFLRRLLEVADA